MNNPAVLLYTSDFITGTLFMSNEEVGAYIRILCMQHQKGHLTKEDMLKICKNETNFLQILPHFKRDRKGLYYNERMEIESEKRLKFVESRAKNRKKKTETYEKHMNNISKTYEEHMENENENINDNENNNNLEKEGYRERKPFKEIVDYLNLKTGSNYKHSTKTTQEKINARLNEGFTLDDFIVVIDKKTVEWIGTDMAKYLRPETLFGNKFESYLNQKARATTLHDIAKTEEFQKYLEEGFNE